MLTIKEWMELVDYRITEGSEYGWQCFGTDAYSLSSWNGDHDGWSFNIVFDTKTQVVYTVEVCDYANERAYRMINPDYKTAHDREARQNNVSAKEAWNEADFVDLEEDDDFIQKALAIKTDEDYDTRVSVPLTVPDDVLFELMKQAHEQDITLNQLVEQILQTAIDAFEDKQFDEDGWDEICEDHLDDDEDRPVLDSQYPDGDGYWREDTAHFTNTDNPIDFPAAKMKAKKSKKK
jgi:hypothetical protein